MARALAKRSDATKRALLSKSSSRVYHAGHLLRRAASVSCGLPVDSAARRHVLDDPIAKRSRSAIAAAAKKAQARRRRSAARSRSVKAKGLTSPTQAFVVSRVNYTRFSKATDVEFEETLDKIIASAAKGQTSRK